MSTNDGSKEEEKSQKSPEVQNEQALINSILAASDSPSKTDMSAAVLEAALRHESDQRKTERFFWIAGGFVMFDVIAAAVTGWALTALVPLEIIILLGLAHWLEVDFVKKPLQELFDKHFGNSK